MFYQSVTILIMFINIIRKLQDRFNYQTLLFKKNIDENVKKLCKVTPFYGTLYCPLPKEHCVQVLNKSMKACGRRESFCTIVNRLTDRRRVMTIAHTSFAGMS